MDASLSFLYDFAGRIITMSKTIFQTITTPLSKLIGNYFDVDLDWFFSLVGDPSILNLMTLSVAFILAFSLVKWLLDVVL